MSTLERAIAIAAKAHEGQVDKAGAPYVLHPLRMMLHLLNTEERITAVLHDVVEDCGVSLETLRAEGFSEQVIEAVDSVTRRHEESYEDFVLRAASNPIGRRVKLVDLQDNSDLSRISHPTARDSERIEKYQRAIETIRAFEESIDAQKPLVENEKSAGT
ncbi:MAG: HD domain-containing protein [Thiobacillaceae bacterium]